MPVVASIDEMLFELLVFVEEIVSEHVVVVLLVVFNVEFRGDDDDKIVVNMLSYVAVNVSEVGVVVEGS